MRSAVRLHACMTVVWLRLPNARPIVGSVASVSSRAEVHGDLAGQATGWARLLESSASSETPNAAQVCSWISRSGAHARAELGVEAGEDLGRRAPW